MADVVITTEILGIQAVNQQLGILQTRLKTLTKTSRAAAKSTGQAAAGITALGKSSKKAAAETKKLRLGTKKAGDAAKGSGKQFKELRDKFTEAAKSAQLALGPLSGIAARITAFSSIVGNVNLKLAILIGSLIGLGAVLLGSTKSAIAFEFGLAQVRKTTGLTNKELETLGTGISKLSIKLGTATDDLLKIASAAGQIGVKGTPNLLLLTDTVAKLAETSDLAGEAAVEAFGIILTVTGEPISNVKGLAAGVTALAAILNRSEQQIIELASEIARAGARFKITSTEALGLGAALATMGVRAEAGGTAAAKAFTAVLEAISEGGKRLQLLALLTGKTAEELRGLLDERRIFEIFRLFITGIGKVGESSERTTKLFDEFSLADERALKGLASLAANFEKFNSILRVTNKEVAEATALDEEFAFLIDTTKKQIDRLGASLRAVAQDIGADLLPTLEAFFRALTKILENTKAISIAIETLAVVFINILLARAIKPALKLLALLGGALIGVAGASAKLSVAVGVLGKAIRFLFGPAGLILLAIEGLFIYQDVLGVASESIDELAEATLRLKEAQGEERESLLDLTRALLEETRARLESLKVEAIELEIQPGVVGGEEFPFLDRVRDEISDIEARLPQLEADLADAIAGVGKEGDKAAKGVTSFADAIDALLKKDVERIGKKAIKVLKVETRDLNKILKAFFQDTTPKAKLATLEFSSAIDNLRIGIRSATDALDGLEPAGKTYKDLIDEIEKGTSALNTALRQEQAILANIDKEVREANQEVDKRIDLIEKENIALRGGERALRDFNREQEILKEIEENLADLEIKRLETPAQFAQRQRDVANATREAIEENQKLNDVFKQQQALMEELQGIATSAFGTISSAIVDAFKGGEDAAFSFRDVAFDIVSEILEKFLELAVINRLINAIFDPANPLPVLDRESIEKFLGIGDQPEKGDEEGFGLGGAASNLAIAKTAGDEFRETLQGATRDIGVLGSTASLNLDKITSDFDEATIAANNLRSASQRAPSELISTEEDSRGFGGGFDFDSGLPSITENLQDASQASDNLEESVQGISTEFEVLDSIERTVLDSISVGLNNATDNGFGFISVLGGIIDKLFEIGNISLGGPGGIFATILSFLPSLVGGGGAAAAGGGAATLGGFTIPGLKHGGDFIVPGQGGPDSQFLPLKVTPGERIIVIPPELVKRSQLEFPGIGGGSALSRVSGGRIGAGRVGSGADFSKSFLSGIIGAFREGGAGQARSAVTALKEGVIGAQEGLDTTVNASDLGVGPTTGFSLPSFSGPGTAPGKDIGFNKPSVFGASGIPGTSNIIDALSSPIIANPAFLPSAVENIQAISNVVGDFLGTGERGPLGGLPRRSFLADDDRFEEIVSNMAFRVRDVPADTADTAVSTDTESASLVSIDGTPQSPMEALLGINNPPNIMEAFLGGDEVQTIASPGEIQTIATPDEIQGFGFAHGGEFVVGGSGGRDSQRVPLDLTPGERVTITPPGQDSGPTTIQNFISMDLRGSNGDAAIEAAVNRGIRKAAPSLIDGAVSKTLKSRRRNPAFFTG